MTPKPRVQSCAECQAWSARYHELVKELMAMKREGFTPQVQGEHIAAPELPQKIRKAISEVSKVGSQTWVHLTKLAWDEVRNGTADDQIAADIRAGESPEL